ncbi:hypothetical protein ACOSQ4_024074 [Xanthoceras sorbifolium]
MSDMLHMSLYRIGTMGLHQCLWMRINKLKMIIILIHLMMMRFYCHPPLLTV